MSDSSDSSRAPGGSARAGSQDRLVAGRYRLARELGRGGMGVVWLAEDQLVGRRVAVKELRAPLGLSDADRDVYAKRALLEARSAARIDHPNAVTLYDVLPPGAADDAMYLIMEYIDGPTLAELIGRDRALPGPRVAGFGLQLLEVLAAAHRLGIVHRDVKPGNIMIAAADQVKLTDFGIAHTIGDTRLTRGGVIGTQAYMAPELFESVPITAAADLWSLGATLYAAASGRGPFDRDTTGATLRAILLDDIPVPRCEPNLATAITRMLQRDPAKRATIEQVRGLLQWAAAVKETGAAPAAPAAPGAVPAQDPRPEWEKAPTAWSASATTSVLVPAPDPTVERPPRPVRRGAMVIAALVATAAITVGVLVVALGGFKSPHKPIAAPASTQKLSVATAHPKVRATHQHKRTRKVRAAPAVTFKLLTTIKIGGEDHNGVLSPNGTMAAVYGAHNRVTLWNAVDGRRIAALPYGGAFSVAFSPHGQTLAVADGNLGLWDIASHHAIRLAGQIDATSVAFSPDGGTLAVTDDKGVQLWDVHTRLAIITLPGLGSAVPTTVAFSPDGKTIAAGDPVRGPVFVWNVASRRLIHTLAPPPAAQAPGQAWIAFSPGGGTLATVIAGQGHVQLWDVVSRKLSGILVDPASGGMNAVAFSPGGGTLAVADTNGTTYLWDILTRKIIAVRAAPHGSHPTDVAFGSTGRMLMIIDSSGSAYVWDVAERG